MRQFGNNKTFLFLARENYILFFESVQFVIYFSVNKNVINRTLHKIFNKSDQMNFLLYTLYLVKHATQSRYKDNQYVSYPSLAGFRVCTNTDIFVRFCM